jgi:hypothetical protein
MAHSWKDSDGFGTLYRQLTAQRFQSASRQPQTVDATIEPRIVNAVEQLRDRGFVVIRGWLDSDAIETGRRQMLDIENRWHELFDDSIDKKEIEDDRIPARFEYSNHSTSGRLRAVFLAENQSVAPPFIRSLYENAELKEIASRYFDSDAERGYVLAERLEPSPEPDKWHFDRITDQMKVMVLLTDVDMAQGPLRYKMHTHRAPPGMDELYYRVFQHGVSEGYPSETQIASMPGEIMYGTGKAGDCFLFDTVGIHSGTICSEGFRQACISAFYGPTKKTAVLSRNSPQAWI